MKKLEFYLKTKSEEIKEMKEVELKHLEKLYLMDYCNKNKCQLIFGDKSQNELDKNFAAKLKL